MEILIIALSMLTFFFFNKILSKKIGERKIFIWSKIVLTSCLLIYLGYKAFTNSNNKQLFFCLVLAIILINGIFSRKNKIKT